MESDSGSVIGMIGGIFHILIDVLLLGLLIIFSGGFPFLSSGPPGPAKEALAVIFGLVMLGMGVGIIVSSRWMKNPQTLRKGGWVSLILGIISLLTIIWWIPGVLAIIAGILALKESKK